MKKWTSLALLGLTSATLLVACGSKKEENSSSVKETQTSMKSGQNKTNQSSKKKNTKETESSSEETTQSSQTSQTTSGCGRNGHYDSKLLSSRCEPNSYSND